MDKFLIGFTENNSGLQTNLRPWLIADNAFQQLNNAYVFRGRVRKRFGSTLLGATQLNSRVRVNMGTTDGSGQLAFTNIPGTTPTIDGMLNVGATFSAGSVIFNVTAVPTIVGGTDNTLSTDPLSTGTVKLFATVPTKQYQFSISGANAAIANTIVYFYPATPIMGFSVFETAAINDEITYAYDRQFAYQFAGGGWERLTGEFTPGASLWTGSDSQFFWTTNYRGGTDSQNLLFVTNYNPPDLMRYWDGTLWHFFNPQYSASGDKIQTARIMVPFQNRLLLFNTVEQVSSVNTTFVNRARWSQLGDPTATDAFRDDISGKGDYLDCPIQEAVITVEFLKDRLIVFMERSTWELAYTGNQVLPFRWQQINTELGSESTFSVVPFDKVALAIGNVGIHACNGSNTERIDQLIPDLVFEIHNGNDGPVRVQGIRDYTVEMVYWTFPDLDKNAIFPTRVLVYNYKTGGWAINNDSITAFGYFQSSDDAIWQNQQETWEQNEATWTSGVQQSLFRNVIAGNQEGFTFIIENDDDATRNAPSLQITNMVTDPSDPTLTIITAINNNLYTDEYIALENIVGTSQFQALNNTIVPIYFKDADTPDPDTFKIKANTSGIGQAYSGGGTISRVSIIDILTKQYNFYTEKDRNVAISRVNFLVDKTSAGQVQIDYFTSSTENSLVDDGTSTGAIVGTAVLETSPYALVPQESEQDRLWHPVYLQADGECIQLRIYLNDAQLRVPAIAWSDFELHAMIFHAMPTASRLQ